MLAVESYRTGTISEASGLPDLITAIAAKQVFCPKARATSISPAWGAALGRPAERRVDPVALRSIASSGDRRWRRSSETAVHGRCR
jgi:hypothetical protein